MFRTSIRAVAVSLIFVAPTLPAQALSFGGELGLNMATYGGKDATTLNAANKIGLLAGVAVKHQKAGSKMFIRSGIGFSQRGAKISLPALGFTGSIKFNYIEVPAMVGMTFPKEGAKMTPHIAGGAALALKAGCTSESTSSGVTSKADCTDVKSMDIMVGGGGGVTMASASGDIAIDLLYLLGLSTIDNPPTGTAQDMKNRGITVKVSYWMKKKK